MQKAFKAGDVVVLRSGSPPMTVEGDAAWNDEWVRVHWFRGAVHNDSAFRPAQLRHARWWEH